MVKTNVRKGNKGYRNTRGLLDASGPEGYCRSGRFPYIVYFLTVLFFGLLVSCNSESAPDCFQASGDTVRDSVMVAPFTAITVFENITLVLQEGTEQKVEIETGVNLREEVSAEVVDGRLLLRDTNDCNFFREYGATTVYVTSPSITEVRSSTGWPIRSDGVLAYPNLRLISESFSDPTSETTDGVFDLDVASENLQVTVNGIAYFQLRGSTETLSIVIAAGDSRIEAEALVAQNVTLNHRGSNDILIDPQETLNGVIRGTGDVISFSRPEAVAVEELYKGRLVYKNDTGR